MDRPQEIDLEWFRDAHRVVLTAGASVPEELVTEVMQWLSERFLLKIKERIYREEQVNFVLPASAISASYATTP